MNWWIPILILQVASPILTHPDPHPAARDAFAFVTDTDRTSLLLSQQGMDGIGYLQMLGVSQPAMGGFDLMDYSPSRASHGQRTRGSVESWIRWAGPDAFVTVSWHWNAPMFLVDEPGREWWRGFYREATTFDLRAALAEPESAEYMALLRDIDVIAEQLAVFRDAGIPVFWRPLHEASGAWFWWGAWGPEPFRQLWQVLHDRLVQYHGLDNLIWVYTVGDVKEKKNGPWYPGDDVVDIVAVDLYGRDADPAAAWRELSGQFGATKPLAVSESDRLPDPQQMIASGQRWAWFSVWSDEHLRDYSPADIRAVYSSDHSIGRDRLPVWRNSPPGLMPAAAVSVAWSEERMELQLEAMEYGTRFRYRINTKDDRTVHWGRGVGAAWWSAHDAKPGPYAVRWLTESDQGVVWFTVP